MLRVGWQKQVIDEARRLQSTGAREGANWTLAETLMAFLLCVFSDPSRLGGTRSTKAGEARQHPGVMALAKALGRTEDSVVMKVMNLRKHLTGGSLGAFA